MPKSGSEEVLTRVSRHLSKCEACGQIHIGFRKIEEALLARKRQLDNIASRTPVPKTGLVPEGPRRLPTKKLRFGRPAWASAATFIIVVAAGSTLFLTTRQPTPPKDSGTSARLTPERPAPVVSSQTLKELAEVVCRHEVALSELPYAPKAVAREPLFPSSVQKYIEPAGTLRAIAESTINLTRRHKT